MGVCYQDHTPANTLKSCDVRSLLLNFSSSVPKGGFYGYRKTHFETIHLILHDLKAQSQKILNARLTHLDFIL